jgi:hypothetical protein
MKISNIFLSIIIFVIFFSSSHCYANHDTSSISIKGTMPLKLFFDEVQKQTGWKPLYNSRNPNIKYFKDITVEVNFNNVNIGTALFELNKFICSKINKNYSHTLYFETKTVIVGFSYDPPHGDAISQVKLKHISCDKMSEIIIQKGYKAPYDKRLNMVLFYTKYQNEVMALIDQYDVELTNSNEVILKPSIK